MILNIDEQAQATIVAALRYYACNEQGDPSQRADLIHELATAGDKVASLDRAGIRALEVRVRDCQTKAALVVVKDDDEDFYVRVFAPRGLLPVVDVLDLNDPDTNRCNDRSQFALLKDGTHPDYPDFDEVTL